MATTDRTPTFSQLATFNLSGGTSPGGTKRPRSPTFSPTPAGKAFCDEEDDDNSLEDEPVLLQEIRSLSVSSDASMDSVESKADEAVTPPHSPHVDTVVVQSTPDQHISVQEDGKSTPIASIHRSIPTLVTPDGSAIPFFVGDVTPPTPPRTLSGTVPTRASLSSPEGGVAARRAKAGKLPNKALVSLQQMRFEASDAGMGLGVGPGSPDFEGLEGVSPQPGMTFRLALGLTPGKDGSSPKASPTSEGSENMFGSPNSSGLGAAPSLLRTPSSTSIQQRRRLNRSASSPGEVKIPPTLRGSKILDKLNLSSPTHLTSPLSPSRCGPPSPLILRSSAYTYSNTGPLTPLTPSHVPGAPDLSGGSAFDYFSAPLTPANESPRPLYVESGISPRAPFFLPTPPSDFGRPSLHRSLSASSPLSDRRAANPFFAST